MDLAMQNGAPVIGLNDSRWSQNSGRCSISRGGYADIFYRNTLASGVIPQISAIMGPCAGGAVYSPATITDFIMMVENNSYMFVTGPNVVKTVTHEDVTSEELGRAVTHATKSGVTHFTCANGLECINLLRNLLSYIPQNCEEPAPSVPYEAAKWIANGTGYNHTGKSESTLRYAWSYSCNCWFGTFLEVHKDFAENIIVGFANGRKKHRHCCESTGPSRRRIGYSCFYKAARFVRFCDCFNIPLFVFEDVPVSLPEQIRNGMV